MTITIEQAREAKEELKPILRVLFNKLAFQTGLGSRAAPEGGRDYCVIVALPEFPTEAMLINLPKFHRLASNVDVPIQYKPFAFNKKQPAP